MNVVQMKPAKNVGKQKSKRAVKVGRAQIIAATGVMSVGVVLTGLSLTHLAHGVQLLTNGPSWESWAMAIGIDLGFIALEIAQLVPMKESTWKKIKGYVKHGILWTMVGSALLNAMAFGMSANGWMVYPAVIFGLAIPGLILVNFKVGAQMWFDR